MADLPRQLATELRSYLRRCPQVSEDNKDAVKHLQRTDRVTKSLNVSPNYATHFNSGIRELLQNWHDECLVLAGGGGLAVQDLTPAVAARARDLLLAATAGGRCCGFLALSGVRGSADTCTVWLCNYGSTVSLAAMTMGESSKRGNDSLAGYFGEGVKVEINRITAFGASVTYYTSNQQWSFRYEKELGSQVLHLHSRRTGDQPSGNTLVVVQGAQRAWFQRHNYLFLLPKPYERFGGSGGSSAAQVELLPEPQHAGRLYVHGFFVSQADNLPLHGLNFCGSRTSLLGMGFGRDRNNVNASALAMHVPQLFVELNGDAARQRELAQLLYAVLDKHPHSAWRSVHRLFWQAEPDGLMADAMYQVFWEQLSRSSIPAAGSGINADAEYLGVKSVKVSDTLFKVLERSQHHPTLDQLWERQYQRLLAIPDHVWREGDEADRYRATLIRTLLATFPMHLTPANLRVKALPAGNRNIIVALQRGHAGGRERAVPAEGPIYIVDLTALCQEEVHRRLRESDPYFECDYQHCACLPIALEDAAIAAIAKAHGLSEQRLRGELRRAQHRHHGLGWRGEMPAAPQPHDAAGFGEEPQPAAEGSEEEASEVSQPGAQAGAAEAGAPAASSGGQPAGAPSGGWQAWPGGGAVAGASEEPPADPHAQLLDAADLEAGVRGSLDPGAGGRGRRARLDILRVAGAGSAAPPPPPARDCRDSRGALVQSSIAVGGGSYLFLPQDVAATSLSAQQVQRCCKLYALLSGMHTAVFLQGQSSTSAFYLYHDPTDGVIAFNLGRAGEAGECWYNAAYDPPEADPVAHAKHWFITTCHELAHNFVRAHNSPFADVMGQIVLRYAPRFCSMYDPSP